MPDRPAPTTTVSSTSLGTLVGNGSKSISLSARTLMASARPVLPCRICARPHTSVSPPSARDRPGVCPLIFCPYRSLATPSGSSARGTRSRSARRTTVHHVGRGHGPIAHADTIQGHIRAGRRWPCVRTAHTDCIAYDTREHETPTRTALRVETVPASGLVGHVTRIRCCIAAQRAFDVAPTLVSTMTRARRPMWRAHTHTHTERHAPAVGWRWRWGAGRRRRARPAVAPA